MKPKINNEVGVSEIAVEPLAAIGAEDFQALVTLLTECVHGGASIGFLAPLPASEAEEYWRKIASELPGGWRGLLVAREAGRIVGAVQLAAEARANGRHRGEVQKLMVLPARRRRGIAGQLMDAVEAAARGRGLRLLFLDTSEGRGGARAFYDARGYVYAGGIPDYALGPDGSPSANAIYYKRLG